MRWAALLFLPAALWAQPVPPPVISSIGVYQSEGPVLPPVVTAGATGVNLEITGTGFSEVVEVLWTSSNPAIGTQILPLLFVDGTLLGAEIPDALIAAADAVQIRVRNPDSQVSGPAAFTVNPPPTPLALPNGTVGVPYGPRNLVTGGTPPFTFEAFTPPLPVQAPVAVAGPPYISGTPAAAGDFTFNFILTDAWGIGFSNGIPYRLQIAPAPALAPATLQRGMVGAAYSQSVAGGASGGNQPYTWSITGGALPPGVGFAAGTFAGTPTGAGVYSATVRLGEAAGGFATQTFTIVVDEALQITTAALPSGVAGAPYSVQVQATGGLAPHTWALGGNLPAGLSLNPSTGAITGQPASAGTSSFTLTVTDAAGRSVQRAFSITVTAFVITTASPLPTGTAGVSYSQTFAATGAPAPYSWAVTAGALPPGLALSAAGVLSGTPSTPGTFNFTVRASSTAPTGAPLTASSDFTMAVNPTNLTLTAELPFGWSGEPYSGRLSATGATPPYTFSIVSGALPDGLFLNAATGVISGSAQSPGPFTFTARVADSSGQSVSQAFRITIERRIAPLVITTLSLPNGVVGTPYGAGVSATGGEGAHTWSIGGLPPGLRANSEGEISGTPTAHGTYTVTAQVSDEGGRTARASFTLIIEPAPLVITTGSPLPDGEVGQEYSASFAATGGVLPYSFAVSGGSTPPGLRFSGGALSGTPAAEGVFDFTIQVMDTTKKVATKLFRLTVRVPALQITTASPLPNGTVGTPYSAGFSATGGTRPYRWTASGLPAGLSLSAAGALNGTPSEKGAHTFTVEVADNTGAKASKAFELTIDPEPLRITTASLANGIAGESYSQSFAAAGGTPPYRWAVAAGWAGPGLSLSGDGTLAGTPSEPGSFTVVVEATDAGGARATRSFTFTIDVPALVITTASPLPAALCGRAYEQGFAVAGAMGEVTWSADAPPGLSMSGGGTMTGTPSSPGSFTFTVRAVDAAGRTAQKSFALTVDLPALPAPSFTGLPDLSDPARQPAFQLGLTGSYPVPITGRLTLAFTPLAGAGDPAVQFSTGGTTVDFTIPAGASLAAFPVPNPAIQTGTVAGTITITAAFSAEGRDITPSPAPQRIIRINPGPPVITEVRVTRTAAGFDVQVTGYATNREVLRGLFRFTAGASGGLGTAEQTVTVDTLFNRWYQDAASRTHGSRFTFVQPFTLQGDPGAVASVTVTLANSAGNSNAVTANVP